MSTHIYDSWVTISHGDIYHNVIVNHLVRSYMNYYPVAGYKIIYSVATLSYDNYYVNLRDHSNSLLSGLL